MRNNQLPKGFTTAEKKKKADEYREKVEAAENKDKYEYIKGLEYLLKLYEKINCTDMMAYCHYKLGLAGIGIKHWLLAGDLYISMKAYELAADAFEHGMLCDKFEIPSSMPEDQKTDDIVLKCAKAYEAAAEEKYNDKHYRKAFEIMAKFGYIKEVIDLLCRWQIRAISVSLLSHDKESFVYANLPDLHVFWKILIHHFVKNNPNYHQMTLITEIQRDFTKAVQAYVNNKSLYEIGVLLWDVAQRCNNFVCHRFSAEFNFKNKNYILAGFSYREAAKLSTNDSHKLTHWLAAVESFKLADMKDEAAQCAKQLACLTQKPEHFEDAIKLFLSIQNYKEAGALLWRVAQICKNFVSYINCAEFNFKNKHYSLAGFSYREAAKLSADSHQQANLLAAVKSFKLADMKDEAAQCAKQLARLTQKREHFEAAITLFLSIPNHKEVGKAYSYLADRLLEDEDSRELALSDLRDSAYYFHRAKEFLLSAQSSEKAGKNFGEYEDWIYGAEAYLILEKYDSAGYCFYNAAKLSTDLRDWKKMKNVLILEYNKKNDDNHPCGKIISFIVKACKKIYLLERSRKNNTESNLWKDKLKEHLRVQRPLNMNTNRIFSKRRRTHENKTSSCGLAYRQTNR